MIFAIDFDGTCVTHEFPAVGRDVPGAVEVLRELKAAGHSLILWTMRSDGRADGDFLAPAVEWFASHGIELFGVNCNPPQALWTSSPKAFANCYIDDAALGCPLVQAKDARERDYVDWVGVRAMLVRMGALPELEA